MAVALINRYIGRLIRTEAVFNTDLKQQAQCLNNQLLVMTTCTSYAVSLCLGFLRCDM